MKKLFVSMLFAFLLFGFIPTVSAEEVDVEAVNQLVLETNTQIEEEILEAQQKADLVMMHFSNNEKVKDYLLDLIIEDLIETTDAISQAAIEEGAQLGVVLVCEYVPVQIGDRIVLVDPIRVHIW